MMLQGKTEFRFLLAHRAKITNTMLAKKLGQVVEALIAGKMDIPNNVDDVMKLILDGISWLGMNTVAGNGEEITVSPDSLKCY